MPTAPTDLGYVNRNDQMVLRKMDGPSADPHRTIYVLRCLECEHEYSVGGSDTPACDCPACVDGLGLARAA